MQVQIDYSIMACSIPCLKPYMAACNTGWGRVLAHPSRTSTLKSGSYALRSLQQNPGLKGTLRSNGDNTVDYKNHHRDGDGQVADMKSPTEQGNEAELESSAAPTQRDRVGADETSQSVASNDSTQMIIRREVVWTVTYEDESPEEAHNNFQSNQTRTMSRVDIEAQTQPNAL